MEHRESWITACCLDGDPNDARLCAAHFRPCEVQRNITDSKNVVMKGAVPSLKLPQRTSSTGTSMAVRSRLDSNAKSCGNQDAVILVEDSDEEDSEVPLTGGSGAEDDSYFPEQSRRTVRLKRSVKDSNQVSSSAPVKMMKTLVKQSPATSIALPLSEIQQLLVMSNTGSGVRILSSSNANLNQSNAKTASINLLPAAEPASGMRIVSARLLDQSQPAPIPLPKSGLRFVSAKPNTNQSPSPQPASTPELKIVSARMVNTHRAQPTPKLEPKSGLRVSATAANVNQTPSTSKPAPNSDVTAHSSKTGHVNRTRFNPIAPKPAPSSETSHPSNHVRNDQSRPTPARSKRKFGRSEPNSLNSSVGKFVDNFLASSIGVADSFHDYSPPPSPFDPLNMKRDVSVQTDLTDIPTVTNAEEHRQTYEKAMRKIEELSSFEVGNEVELPIDVASSSVSKASLYKKRADTIEEGIGILGKALMGVFNECEADTAFASLSDGSAVPPDDADSVHPYGTAQSIHVLKSAAQFCDFNAKKIQQLEELIQKDKQGISELEDTIVENLGAVMCVTGVEFIRKCFDRVLRQAVERNRAKKDDALASQKSKNEESAASRVSESYSPETKQMAKTLLLYSGKGYLLLKQIADLPSPSAVRHWLVNSDGGPLFSQKALKLWGSLNWAGKTRMCSLCVVEVPLLEDVSWDGERLFGYEDLGFGSVDNDEVREASKAVVFFVKMLYDDKILPVGYFLAVSLTPQVKANLITQCLAQLDTMGLRCVALVCEYSRLTYETFVELGAITGEPDSGSFQHPNGKGSVACFTDIHQNTKALCNLWAEKKVFRSSATAESAIEWDYIAKGEAFLEQSSLYSSFPVTGKLLSDLASMKSQAQKDISMTHRFNAVMLTIIRNLGVKTFASASETIKYLENLTSATDLFSSSHPYDIADKKPLNASTACSVQTKMTSLALYFASLCFGNGTKIRTTDRKMPVVMMKMNLCNLKELFRHLVKIDRTGRDLYTERLTLKDIGTSVATICGGEKRLVTAVEFKRGFNLLLDKHSWSPSARLSFKPADAPKTADSFGFCTSFVYDHSPFESASENPMAFMADIVIETWLGSVECFECSQLVQRGIQNFAGCEDNVVRDIQKMIRTAETCLAELGFVPCDFDDVWFQRFTSRTMNSMASFDGFKSCNHLFVSSRFGETCHFSVLVKDILKTFLKLRLCFLNRREVVQIRFPRDPVLKFSLGRSRT